MAKALLFVKSVVSFPGRSAARSGALQSRGPGLPGLEETGVPVLRSGTSQELRAASRPGHDRPYSTLPIFFTAAISRALSASTNFANSGASI